MMNAWGFALLLAGFLTTSGCIGDLGETDAGPTSIEDDAMAGVGPEASPAVLTWDGHIVVGAALEAPAHFTPSDEIVRPIWSTGFVVEIHERPEVLEVSVDWKSIGPSSVMMMVHAPHGAERQGEQPGWSEYTTHGAEVWASQGPLCIRIPSADLEEDLAHVAEHGGHAYWYPMAHSQFGVDVQLTFTVGSVGGNVSIPDAIHGHETAADEIGNGAKSELGPKRPWEPCQPGAGA